MAIRVIIVSAIRLYREGLERTLDEDEQIHIVGTAASVVEALGNLSAIKPDVILLDVAAGNPVAAIQQIVEKMPNTQIVALSVPESDGALIAYAEAGVSGFVTRNGSVDELIASIKAAAAGELQCSPKVAGLLIKRVAALATKHHKDSLVGCLTRCELRILELIGQNLCNKERLPARSILKSPLSKTTYTISLRNFKSTVGLKPRCSVTACTALATTRSTTQTVL